MKKSWRFQAASGDVLSPGSNLCLSMGKDGQMTDLLSTSWWWSPCPVVSIDVFAQLIPPRFGLGLFLFLSSLTGRRQRKCTVLKKHAFSPFKTID